MTTGPKKFGAFSGVFTPSILTILGVIMYLRLGWVSGVAGLVGVVAIILLAHVISFTTGLSISSIATDKKIKAGGIYYILSRSLGLPMGGSIGITLFVGTALSISMYIVGFTESFLAIPAISGWIQSLFGLGPEDMRTVQILGSTVLLLLVIIAFISTDIAIKTQFLILTAIALSLISVFVGFFVHPELAPKGGLADYKPFQDFSFEVVFAVFFPAVTGFTAGVAMSGDLKDPKKDIPKGTMWAIIVGFVVYLALGISFVLFVDRDILLHDYNFLLKLAWIPALVIAGIWGATLSSALGGILGGPRILQAIANDRIVPRFFGKGYGINNEPRNALIFTFLIAEAGVLIGDLNVIAGIVTMFYLTAYGFINLAFSLEKWASTDFRPSFNIPVWVGIIGFLASFMIMFKLDMVSMFIALIILFGIYYYIERKQLKYRGSNVWQSVYVSLVKSILIKLNKEKFDEKNWRPNVLLFSGGTNVRPHLIEFGKYIVAKSGIISNFDLIENKDSEVLFSRNLLTDAEKEKELHEGIFTRRQECNDIYSGIEIVSAVYGFSGIEPNTVLLGWGRHSSNPVRFVKMIKRLAGLDMNIVLLDYDKERKFGNYELIDVWLRGGSNNGSLMLALIKFIKSTFEWKNARVRLMIVNPVNENKTIIEHDAIQFITNMRIEAEVRVINNEIDKRPINEIIKQESINSDLIFLGIPDVEPANEKNYIQSVDNLCSQIGTTVLIKASSLFKDLTIGIRPGELMKFDALETESEDNFKKLPKLIKPVSYISYLELQRINHSVTKTVHAAVKKELIPLVNIWENFLEEIENIWSSYYEDLHLKLKDYYGDLRIIVIERNLTLVESIREQIKDYRDKEFKNQSYFVESFVADYPYVLRKIRSAVPETVILKYSDEDIENLLKEKKISRKEAKILKKRRVFKVNIKKVKENLIINGLSGAWLEMLKELEYRNFLMEQKLNRLIVLIEDYQPGKYQSSLEKEKAFEVLRQKEESFNQILNELEEQTRNNKNIIRNVVLGEIIRLMNKTSMLIETPFSLKRNFKKVKIKKSVVRENEKYIDGFFEVWKRNRNIMSKVTFANLSLLTLKLNLRHVVIDNISQITSGFYESVLSNLTLIKEHFENKNQTENIFEKDNLKVTVDLDGMLDDNENLISSLLKGFPEKIQLFTIDKYNNYKEFIFDDENIVDVNFYLLVGFVVKTELLDFMRKTFDNIKNEIDEYNSLVSALKEKQNPIDKELIAEIDRLLEKLDKQKETFNLSMNERLNSVWDKLNISTFTIQNELLQSYIKIHKEKERKSLMRFLKKVKSGNNKTK